MNIWDELNVWVVKSGVSLGGLPEPVRRLLLAVPAQALPVGQTLSEPEVNEILRQSLAGACRFLETDHVELRRWLVDTGWWQRDGFGRAYWRTADADVPESCRAIASAVAGVSLASWVADCRGAEAQRRQARRQAWEARPAQGHAA